MAFPSLLNLGAANSIQRSTAASPSIASSIIFDARPSFDVFNSPDPSIKLVSPNQLPADYPATATERLLTALGNTESAAFQVDSAVLGGKKVLVAKMNPSITSLEGYYGAFQTQKGGPTAQESGSATKGKYRLDDPSLKNQTLASLGMMLNNYQVPNSNKKAIFKNLKEADKQIKLAYEASKKGDRASAIKYNEAAAKFIAEANKNVPQSLWGGAYDLEHSSKNSGDHPEPSVRNISSKEFAKKIYTGDILVPSAIRRSMPMFVDSSQEVAIVN